MMVVSVCLPLLCAGLFAVSAPSLSHKLPPAAATWLLSIGSLLAAVGSTVALTVVGLTFVAQNRQLAQSGHWSEQTLRHAGTIWTPVAVLAVVAVMVLAARTALAGWRRVAALRQAHQLAAALPAAGGELVVLDLSDRQALAVPGRPGRIVLSTGLLRALDAGQRRAVLAHERSHLRHHHHLHQSITRISAAANPLLHRLPAAVGLACERWADEDAAQTCRRNTVADALTRAAADQTRSSFLAGGTVLAAAETEVAVRIGALRRPSQPPSPWHLAVLFSLLAATALATFAAAHDTEHLFELAQSAYLHGSH
jgi:Zn-dependent protease with chaperone function